MSQTHFATGANLPSPDDNMSVPCGLVKTVEYLIHSLKRVTELKPLSVRSGSSIRGSMMLALLSETAMAMARYEMKGKEKAVEERGRKKAVRKRNAIAACESACGRMVVLTTSDDSLDEVLVRYRGRNDVESDFKMLKTDLQGGVKCLQTDLSADGMIFTSSYLSYSVANCSGR